MLSLKRITNSYPHMTTNNDKNKQNNDKNTSTRAQTSAIDKGDEIRVISSTTIIEESHKESFDIEQSARMSTKENMHNTPSAYLAQKAEEEAKKEKEVAEEVDKDNESKGTENIEKVEFGQELKK